MADIDDDDDEALRLAVLKTLRSKKPPQPTHHQKPPLNTNRTFQRHGVNPNLIAIIPIGAEPPRQSFPRHQRGRPYNSGVPHPSPGPGPWPGPTLKTLHAASPPCTTVADSVKEEAKEEVSTKFSRFEDTESESEEESDDDKQSESSEDADDVLAIEDDDDSLEALMAQMEHEIESGVDLEPSKKDKKSEKKAKSNKTKEKDGKSRHVEKNEGKAEVKLSVVDPSVKESKAVDSEETRVVKRAPSPPLRAASPARVEPIKPAPEKRPSPDRRSRSPQRLPSPKHRSRTPPPAKVPRGRSPTIRIVVRNRTTSLSPRVRSKSPVPPRSPRRSSPAPRRFTPDRRSPARFYSGINSPLPCYKPREREYSPRRSRSPMRRRSLTPRKVVREASPRFYLRRSRSPWSPHYRSPSPLPRYRSRSPMRRRSLSPKGRKLPKAAYGQRTPPGYSPKRRTPSPRKRSRSPLKKDYSPRRRASPPKREFAKRSLSPRRKSPPYKKYSPVRSPVRAKPRSPTPPQSRRNSPQPRRNSPQLRRNSPQPRRASPAQPRRNSPLRREAEPRAKGLARLKNRSRSRSLSLSPERQREAKEQPTRRYRSPPKLRKEANENGVNRLSKRRDHSASRETKDKRNVYSKNWDKEKEERREARRKERGDRERGSRREKSDAKAEKLRQEEVKEEPVPAKAEDNPVFEARRKKFESTAFVEPARKKIRLVNKKESPEKEEIVEEEVKVKVEEEEVEKKVEPTEDDYFSGQGEIDEIDNFLNEDVLDLSAEVWSSDDDLFPKPKIITKLKKPLSMGISPLKRLSPPKEKIKLVKGKAAVTLAAIVQPMTSNLPAKKCPEIESPPLRNVKSSPEVETCTKKHASPEPEIRRKKKPSPEADQRDDSDLRAELSRRRVERLTKAGSLHEKLPARLLQSAFESALGTKKVKKEEKTVVKKSKKKSSKESTLKEEDSPPPVRKERSDGRRVLVLKRPAQVRMQSTKIDVHFRRDDVSDSESSYSSSSSEERYAAATPRRKLPIYMRLGTATATTTTTNKGRRKGRRRKQTTHTR